MGIALHYDSNTILQNTEVRYTLKRIRPWKHLRPLSCRRVNAFSGSSPTFNNLLRIRDSENIGLYIQNGSPRLEGLSIERSGRRAIQQTACFQSNLRLRCLSQQWLRPYRLGRWNNHYRSFLELPGIDGRRVGTALRVNPDVTLNLAAGTILKFQTGAYFEIAVRSRLSAIVVTQLSSLAMKTIRSAVTPTATETIPYQSRPMGVALHFGSGNSVEYVEVRYAGKRFGSR